MRTEIVKIVQYLREGEQEKAEAYAKQLKINTEKSKNLDEKRFAKRVLDAFYGAPVDPEKTVCLDDLTVEDRRFLVSELRKQSDELEVCTEHGEVTIISDHNPFEDPGWKMAKHLLKKG